jgi:hypothetical protein
LYHYHVNTRTFDTLYATINLTLNAASGTFAVTGDTSVNHAGSFGSYSFGYGSDIIFTDKTITSPSTKQHLNGDYTYNYNGNVLNMLKIVGDTLAYHYNLGKTN